MALVGVLLITVALITFAITYYPESSKGLKLLNLSIVSLSIGFGLSLFLIDLSSNKIDMFEYSYYSSIIPKDAYIDTVDPILFSRIEEEGMVSNKIYKIEVWNHKSIKKIFIIGKGEHYIVRDVRMEELK